jgi:cell shape-determining protein MreC
MTTLPNKEQLKLRINDASKAVKLYFNNLWDALLGRTQGFVDEMYTIVDGVSEQVYELMLEKDKLEKQIAQLKAKPVKKTAAVAKTKPVKKTTKKASGK